jgi:hypothetical protein
MQTPSPQSKQVLNCPNNQPVIDDDDVDGARLRLWTAATSWSIVHPPGDVWAWRATVEWYRQGETPDSSTRALWKFYQNSDLVGSKQEEWVKGMMNLALRNMFVHTC